MFSYGQFRGHAVTRGASPPPQASPVPLASPAPVPAPAPPQGAAVMAPGMSARAPVAPVVAAAVGSSFLPSAHSPALAAAPPQPNQGAGPKPLRGQGQAAAAAAGALDGPLGCGPLGGGVAVLQLPPHAAKSLPASANNSYVPPACGPCSPPKLLWTGAGSPLAASGCPSPARGSPASSVALPAGGNAAAGWSRPQTRGPSPPPPGLGSTLEGSHVSPAGWRARPHPLSATYSHQPPAASATAPAAGGAVGDDAAEAAARFQKVQHEVEKSVKNIESIFGIELQKTTDRLHTDIASCQDQMQRTLSSQHREHHSAVAELRREFQQQQTVIVELSRQLLKMSSLESRLELELGRGGGEPPARDDREQAPDVHALVEKVRADVERSIETQGERHEKFVSEWEHFKGAQQAETSLQQLQAEVDALREELRQRKGSGEEVRALHKDIMETADELGLGIQVVSAASAATEQRLRQEIEATRQVLDTSIATRQAELSEVLRGAGQIEQLRLHVEGLQADVARLEASAAEQAASAAAERLGDLEGTLRGLDGEVASAAERLAATEVALGAAPRGEVLAQEVRDLWAEMAMVKATLQAMDSAAQAEADARRLEAAGEPPLALSVGPRMAELESRLLGQASVAERVRSLEAEIRQMRGARRPCDGIGVGVEHEATRECSPVGSARSSLEGLAGAREGQAPAGTVQAPAPLHPGKLLSMAAPRPPPAAGEVAPAAALTPSDVSQLPTPQAVSADDAEA